MRNPDRAGAFAQVWKIDTSKQNPQKPAAMATYIFHHPSAHPFWSWYFAGLVSLKDIPDAPPAYKNYPQAKHEFMIFALDPDFIVNIDSIEAGEIDSIRFLQPPNLVKQFHGLTDEQSLTMVDLLMKAVCDGILNPDSDYRNVWERTITSTIEHIATEGKHNHEV